MPITSTKFLKFQPHERGHFRNVERELRFDVNALADFEEKTGMGFSQLMSTRAVYGATRAMLWAGLKHEDPSLSIEAVGKLMSLFIKGGGNVNELMMEAMAAATEQGAFGEPDEAAAGKIRAATNRVLELAAGEKDETALSEEKLGSVIDLVPANSGSGGLT